MKNKMRDPRIHLGIDNCFAIKRWTAPMEWGKVISDMGLRYVEAVPDLECEPLLTPDDYRDDWVREVLDMQQKLEVKVVMSYSNDSTYDSIGFSHPDRRIRDMFVDRWFGNFVKMAKAIGSDIGYYVQATPESMLFSREGRKKAYDMAFDCICRVNRLAGESGISHVVMEQMYTPHQPPFTIQGMKDLILKVSSASGVPFYFTEDVGHHCPDYMMPTEEQLQSACRRYLEDRYIGIWLGSREAVKLFCEACRPSGLTVGEIDVLKEDFSLNSDQFNEKRDTDCYSWLSELGAWSPVIHMQQTDGKHSSHAPFGPETNCDGIIDPARILGAIANSYEAEPCPGMPERCSDIYLIQELYLSTRDIGYQGLYKLQASTDYLRRFIPHDGMLLSELLEYNKVKR